MEAKTCTPGDCSRRTLHSEMETQSLCKLLTIEPYTVILKKGNEVNLILNNNEPTMNSTNAEEDSHSHSFIHIENTFDPGVYKIFYSFISQLPIIYSHSKLYFLSQSSTCSPSYLSISE